MAKEFQYKVYRKEVHGKVLVMQTDKEDATFPIIARQGDYEIYKDNKNVTKEYKKLHK